MSSDDRKCVEFRDGRWHLIKAGRDKGRLCPVRFCTNQRPEGRRRRKTGWFKTVEGICNRCRSYVWRLNNPVKDIFRHRKNDAKRRGQTFTLTFEEFEKLVTESGYVQRRGQRAQDLQIDRIVATRGYEPGNVRVITTSHNARKGVLHDRHEHRANGTEFLPIDHHPISGGEHDVVKDAIYEHITGEENHPY